MVVEHDVILKANYTTEYEKVFQQATETVETTIKNVTAVQINNSNNTCTCNFRERLERGGAGASEKPLLSLG